MSTRAADPSAPSAAPSARAAQPLFVAGIIAMAVGALRCGRSTAALVIAGGALAYASMFILGGGMDGMGSMGGTSAGRAATNAPMFYAGVALVGASFAWSALRRRVGRCRAVWRARPVALANA